MLSLCSSYSSWVLETICFKIPIPQSTECHISVAPLTPTQTVLLIFFTAWMNFWQTCEERLSQKRTNSFCSHKNPCFQCSLYPLYAELGIGPGNLLLVDIYSRMVGFNLLLSGEMQIYRVHWRFSSLSLGFATQMQWLRLSSFSTLTSYVGLQSMANGIGTWSTLNLQSGVNLLNFLSQQGKEMPVFISPSRNICAIAW